MGNNKKMKQKYLLLADGSSPHILKWAKELVKYFDVYIISLNGVSQELLKVIDSSNIYVLNNKTISTGGNYKLIFKLPQIKKIIKSISPDYLSAHYLSSYGFLGALSASVVPSMKLIQSTWGSDVLVEPFINSLRKIIAKYALSKANFITSDSWYVGDVITDLVGKKEIIVFPFGFDKIEKNSISKEKIIFSNRALKDFYKIDKILQWFARQDDDYKLVIANDGVERDKLELLTKKLGIESRVQFVGYLSTEEQEEYYKKAIYYISIPSFDATSVSLLEAMMYGAIPIVSNIPANREWILDGVNGVFFEPSLKINMLKIDDNFAQINYNVLKKRALFPKSIEEFIKKVKS